MDRENSIKQLEWQKQKTNKKLHKKIGGVMAAAVLLAAMAPGKLRAEENGSLSLYMSTWELESFQAAIDTFRKQYPEVELNIETWDPYSDSLFGQAEKLAAELMAGEGPDLLISENFPTQDLLKLMKAQVYAPLDEFMAREDCWNDENYVMSVIDSGKFGGVQYVMPFTYTPQLMLSSREAMEEGHLTEEECPDTLSLMKAVAALYDTDYSQRILADWAQLSQFPLCLDGDFLDYEKGEILTDPRMLKEACEAYARMYEEESAGSTFLNEPGGYGAAIIRRQAYCYFTTYSGIGLMMECLECIAKAETPAVLPLCNAQGETLANVNAYAGIRANSTNKENAWNLLRLMMDEEAQKAYALSRSSYSVARSVMKEVLEEEAEAALEQTSGEGAALGKDFMEQLRSIVMNPQRVIFISDIVVREFKTRMEPFYCGEADYEECLEDFEGFAKIYLTE